MDTTVFVGLDAHNKTITVVTVEGRASTSVHFFGTIANTPAAIRSVLRKLSKGGRRVQLAYEAGPFGYTLYRLATGLGHRCYVVAPSLIPKKAGDKIKTDRRDAMTLEQTLRAGQLTEVWVPDEAHEAMRDLMRVRALTMKDLRRARQQLISFFLRHDRSFPGKHWTKAHRR
jgi:transposase